MTAEQHKAYTEACNAFGEALERIFSPGSPRIGGQDVYIVKRSRSVEDTVRDWEILEFKASTGIDYDLFLFERDNYMTRDKQLTYRLDHVLDFVLTKQWTIHSVRRLSDNTIWIVGGDHKAHIEHKISSFGVEDGVMYVNPGTLGKMALEYIKKPDLVLTTEDGVNCYNRLDTLLWINEGVIVSSPASYILEQGGKAYSTREAAEKAYDEWLYIQPVLSIWDFDGCSETGEALTARLKELVKDKIAKR